MLRPLGVVVLSTLLLAACGSEDGDPGGTSGYDQKREWRVAGDPDATADEIIDAGRAVDVAIGGQTTLITYIVQSDDDEGPQQGAWRLYDESGKAVADDRLGVVSEQGAGAGATATDDGFLLESYTEPHLITIYPDGTTRPAKIVDRSRPVQAGDLYVWVGDADQYVYRSADHSAYRLPKLPTSQPQGITIDDQGVVWVVLDWDRGTAKLASSAGGAGPWRREKIVLGKGGYPVSDPYATAGEVILASGHGSDEYPVLDSLWIRPAGAGDTPWRATPLTDVEGLKASRLGMQTLSDGRLLLEGDSEGTWLQQPNGGFARLKLPKSARGGRVDAAGDRLYITSGPAFLVSEDDGETWSEVVR
jgi:hypothetical protein